MHRANYACSTPEFGQNRTIGDIALSAIRNDASSSESRRVVKAKKIIGKRRVKNVRKKIVTAPRNHLTTDSNSDSEFETVNEYETSGEDVNSCCGNDLPKNRLFSATNNSTVPDSPIRLFLSPNPERWENYEKLLDVTEEEEDQMPKSPSPILSSPDQLQESFRDSATIKPYVVPAQIIEKKKKKEKERQKKLTAEEIAFSVKWPKAVASKYNSPMDVPSRETTRRSKYSHLNVQGSDKFKRFVSPRKRPSRSGSSVDYSWLFDDEDVHHVPMRKDSGNESKFVVKPLRDRYSKNGETASIDRSIGKNLSLIFDECVAKEATILNCATEESEFDLLKSDLERSNSKG